MCKCSCGKLACNALTLSSEAASAWNQHPCCGDRWSRQVCALAHAEPLHVDRRAALRHALADAEGKGSAEAAAHSSALGRESAANVSLSRALSSVVDCSGYLPALGQAALLEAYGGPSAAVEAASLADAVPAVERPAPNQASSASAVPAASLVSSRPSPSTRLTTSTCWTNSAIPCLCCRRCIFLRVGVCRALASSSQHLRTAYSGPHHDRVRARA